MIFICRNIEKLLIFLILLPLIGCSSSRMVQSENFTYANIQNIHVGMTEPDIVLIFGKPNVVRTIQYGKRIGKSWEGLVYQYNTVKNPNYKFVEKFLTNTFVFYKGANPPKLNHWNIQYQM